MIWYKMIFLNQSTDILWSFSHIYAPVAISLITDVCCVSLIISWIQFSIWLHIIVDCGLDLIVFRYYQLYWVLVILFLLRIVSESILFFVIFPLFSSNYFSLSVLLYWKNNWHRKLTIDFFPYNLFLSFLKCGICDYIRICIFNYFFRKLII